MFKGSRFVRLEDGVLVELISDKPEEDLGKFTEFLVRFKEQNGAEVPIVKGQNGEVLLAVGDNEVVPLPREVVKTLYKTPMLAVAVGNEAVAEEVARFSLVPEVILRELL